MKANRMEAFSDGVLAIVITIMVLELKAPPRADLSVPLFLLPAFVSYVLSFIYIGIYWNNHHHLVHTVRNVNGGILWANLHLLFWLSLFPLSTAWMGENHFAPAPTAVYGVVLLMASIAYLLLQRAIIASQGADSLLRQAVGRDLKGKASTLRYLVAIPTAFLWPWISASVYAFVALIWLIPDRRIEHVLDA